MRCRYLHSEIDTLERVKILRDLRRGEFDVLIGINLLREGLDLPEVSLVAILDADKEGFLRSRRLADPDHRPRRAPPQRPRHSLRRRDDRLHAPRHRRNQPPAPGPVGVQRRQRHHAAIHHQADRHEPGRDRRRRLRHGAARSGRRHRRHDARPAHRYIAELETQMREAAKKFEFEHAAQIRDKIKSLKARDLATTAHSGLTGNHWLP